MARNRSGKGARTFGALLTGSVIVTFFCRITSAIYNCALHSIFASIVMFYGSLSEKFKSSFCASLIRKRKEKNGVENSVRRKVSRLYETSLVSSALSNAKLALLACPLALLGIVFFSFGFYSAVIILLRRFAFSFTPINVTSISTSIIFIFISVAMFCSKKNVLSFVNDSKMLGLILFHSLALRKAYLADENDCPRIPAGIMVIAGLILGAATIFFEPFSIALVFFVIIGCVIIFNSPESGIIAMFFCIPFFPTKALIFIALVTEASYLFKCIRRKRVAKFTFIDIFVAGFAVLMVSGGFISVDMASSIPKMLVYTLFLLTYFVVKNLIRSEKLLHRCFDALVASAFFVSVIGIAQYFFGNVSTKWLDTSMFADIRGRAVSTLQNPNVLGEYLILLIPVIFTMMLFGRSANKRFFRFVTLIVSLACLIFTWSRGAWLGFAVGVILFIIFSSHRSFAGFIILIPALLAGLVLLGGTALAGRALSIGSTSDSSTMYRVNIWQGVLGMLSDVWHYGIGIGEGAFGVVYPQYSLSGVEVAPHSHSLFLQIIGETGIFSLLLMAAIILCITSMVLHYIRHSAFIRQKLLCLAALCGFIAFTVQGLTDYVWYNYRIFLLFWLFTGLIVSAVETFDETENNRPIYQ